MHPEFLPSSDSVHVKKEEKVSAISRKRLVKEILTGGMFIGVLSGLIVSVVSLGVSSKEASTVEKALRFLVPLVTGVLIYAGVAYLRNRSNQRMARELDEVNRETERFLDEVGSYHEAHQEGINKERIALLKKATYIRPVPESVGMGILELLRIMVYTADTLRSRVYTTYKDQTLVVYPGQSVEGAYRTWKEDPHLAYWNQGIYREAKRLKAERLIQEKKRRRLFRALRHAPAMARDEMVWHNIAKHLVKDPSDAAILRYAENWARLMQAQLAKGVSIKNSAEKMAAVAYIEPCSRAAAVPILLSCWKYRKSLRNWLYDPRRARSKKKADNFNGRIRHSVKVMIIKMHN